MNQSTRLKAVAVAYVIILLATAGSFALLSPSADADTVYELTEEDIALAEAYMADAAGVGPIGDYDTDLGLLAIVAVAVVAFTVGVIVEKYVDKSHNDHNAGSQTQVDNYAQSMEATKIDYANSVLTPAFESLLPNDTGMLNFARTYFARQMEYGAAATWEKNKAYNADSLLAEMKVRSNLDSYIYQWQYVIDTSYNDFASNQKDWNTSALKSMTYAYKWTGGSYSVSTDGSSYPLMDICSAVTGSSNGTQVYIDVTEGGNAQSNSMYIFGAVSASLRNPTTGEVVKSLVYNQANDLSDLAPGVYTLDSGVTYAGPMMYSASTDADMSAAIVLGDGRHLVTPYGSGVKVVSYSGGWKSAISSDFGFEIGYTDTDGKARTCSNSLVDVLNGYDGLLDTARLVISDAVNAGDACWKIYDACESSSAYIHPSSVMTTLADSGMSTQEIMVQYVNAMSQITTLYETNKEALMNVEFDSDVDTFGLLVYGDILYNGSVVEGCGNVIFTPYAYAAPVGLTVGKQTEWAQSGFATVWGTASDVTEFQGRTSITSTADAKTIILGDGFTFDVKGLMVDGRSADSHVMEQTEIIKSDYEVKDHETHDVPQVMDSDILMLLLILETGLFIAYIGFSRGMNAVTVFGMIIAIAGVLWPQVFVDLWMGDFEMEDLVPLRWL